MGSKQSSQEDFALPTQQYVTQAGSLTGGVAPQQQAAAVATAAAAKASQASVAEVRMPLVWTKEMQLERAQGSNVQWNLQVEFKADVDCDLHAHFHCVEQRSDAGLTYAPVEKDQGPASFQRSYKAGKHVVELSGSSAIDVQRWPRTTYWQYSKGSPHVLPIVFSLSSPGVQSVIYLSLALQGKDLICQVIRQKAIVNGKAYDLQEVFGLAEMEHESHDESSVGEPCVICMCEPRNTAMTPCQHLCVCASCGGAIRARADKCPICRGKVTGLQTFQIR